MKRTPLFAVVLLSGCATVTAISDDIARACGDALPTIDALAPIVSVNATAAGTVASLQAACTLNGQAQLRLNDAAPVSPTNSGHSAGWIAQSLNFLNNVAAALKPKP